MAVKQLTKHMARLIIQQLWLAHPGLPSLGEQQNVIHLPGRVIRQVVVPDDGEHGHPLRSIAPRDLLSREAAMEHHATVLDHSPDVDFVKTF